MRHAAGQVEPQASPDSEGFKLLLPGLGSRLDLTYG